MNILCKIVRQNGEQISKQSWIYNNFVYNGAVFTQVVYKPGILVCNVTNQAGTSTKLVTLTTKGKEISFKIFQGKTSAYYLNIISKCI